MAQTPSVPAVIAPVDAALVVAQREPPAIPADMRAGMMTLPVEQMEVVAAEYIDRRKAFREWLRSQLVQGVHYGYPPGTEPKYDNDGNLVSSYWSKRDNKKVETKIKPDQWKAKPSLYKAGADFICDLLVARDEYAADMAGWEQLGKPAGVFVYSCRLYSRANGDLIGEGRGVRAVGQKGGDENNAIKMAKKSAKVDAVLNAYGLSDLFTQDIEDAQGRGPQHDAPEQKKGAPHVPPRDDPDQAQIDKRQFDSLIREFEANTEGPKNGDALKAFVVKALGGNPIDWNPCKQSQWVYGEWRTCMKALGVPDEAL